eukprot:11124233-Heterocapsa_arctica.AAC.1
MPSLARSRLQTSSVIYAVNCLLICRTAPTPHGDASQVIRTVQGPCHTNAPTVREISPQPMSLLRKARVHKSA